MSTKAKLDKLLETKEAIKKAIQIKGGDVGDVFDEYPTAIKNLKAGYFTVPAGIKFGYSPMESFPEDWNWSEWEKNESLTSAFRECYNIKTIPKLNVSPTSVQDCFNGCSKMVTADLSNWDTNNCQNMNQFFYYDVNLKNIIWDFNTSKNKDFTGMFYKCESLTDIPELDATANTKSSYSSYTQIFDMCYELRNLGGLKGINVSWYLNTAYSLNYESLLNVLNCLADGVSGKTLYLHQDLVNQLSDDDIAIATNKGWTISPAKTITAPVVVTNLSQVPTSAYNITPRTYDFSQYTGSWTAYKGKPYVFEADLSGTTDASEMFSGNGVLRYVDLKNTHNIANASDMFGECTKIKNIPLFNTQNVTDMYGMFYKCTSLVTIPQFDTSSVTTMRQMFEKCTSLKTIPQLDTSNVTDMRYMFNECTSLTTIPQLDTSNVTQIYGMFNGCTSLVTVPHLNLSKADAISGLFQGCTSLVNIESLDTTNVTNMNSTFSFCSSLKSIPAIDTSKVTTMQNTFQRTSLVPQIDTSSVTDMSYIFRDTLAETIDLSNWDTTNLRTATMMFTGDVLKEVVLGDIPNLWTVDFMFSTTPSLESITMRGAAPKANDVTRMFSDIKPNGKFYYNSAYDYSKIIAALPETWTAIPLTE